MAAGGRNPQKSARARAKRQAQMAQEGKGGGGASAKAERQGAEAREQQLFFLLQIDLGRCEGIARLLGFHLEDIPFVFQELNHAIKHRWRQRR